MDPFFYRFFADRDATRYYYAELAADLPDAGTVLDLGCGDHGALAYLRTPRRAVWGTDLVRHPRLQHPEWFRLVRPDGRIPFPAETFDVVGCRWVLEHVAAPAAFLREANRVLRPGGRLVALTPDRRHYVTWVTRLFHALPHALTQLVVRRLYGRAPEDTFPAYFQLNTPRDLHRAVCPAGLRLCRVRRFANPDYFSFAPMLRRAAIVTDWALERLFPGRGRLYLVVTLTKPGATTMTLPQAA